MIDIRVDKSKNRLFLKLSGFFNDDEVKEASDKLIQSLEDVKPGFDVINDISEFKPARQSALQYIADAQKAVYERKPGRVVRVSQNVLSEMQFKKSQEAASADYELLKAGTVEEAEKLLDS